MMETIYNRQKKINALIFGFLRVRRRRLQGPPGIPTRTGIAVNGSFLVMNSSGDLNIITVSYFSSKAPGCRKVCIALYYPRFSKKGMLHVRELAPSDLKAVDWRASYRRDLRHRFPGGRGLGELLQHIMAAVPYPVLCCYEKEAHNCHRSVLASYILENLGVQIPEWSPGK